MESSTNESEPNVKRDEVDVDTASEKTGNVTKPPVDDDPGTVKNEEPQIEESAIQSSAATESIPLAADAADPQSSPPLSKKALKRKRRWDEKLAVKKRRKEHAREAKRAKAILDGRDVEKERRDIEERTKEGEGRKRREKVRIDIGSLQSTLPIMFLKSITCYHMASVDFRTNNIIGRQVFSSKYHPDLLPFLNHRSVVANRKIIGLY